jgi:hypothetical protein
MACKVLNQRKKAPQKRAEPLPHPKFRVEQENNQALLFWKMTQRPLIMEGASQSGEFSAKSHAHKIKLYGAITGMPTVVTESVSRRGTFMKIRLRGGILHEQGF